jgi:hypothetical protein
VYFVLQLTTVTNITCSFDNIFEYPYKGFVGKSSKHVHFSAMAVNVFQQTNNTNSKYSITVLLKSSTPVPGLQFELVLQNLSTNVVRREIIIQVVFRG